MFDRQREIYLEGAAGRRPELPTDGSALEDAACRALDEPAFAYLAGGAGSGSTMRNNRRAFDRVRIVPRMLRDVSACDFETELFGSRLPAPLLLAPIGVLELFHPEADLAVARAAAACGVPMISSNQASRPMEDCAAVLGDTPHWFQLYWSRENDLVASFAARAEACGSKAVVVTLDTTRLGWRPRDLDLAHLPFLAGCGIAQYTSDPVFRRLAANVDRGGSRPGAPSWSAIRTLVEQAGRYPGPTLEALRSGKARDAVRTFVEIYSNPALNWSDLAFLREHTSLPVVLKGIQHVEDAARAVEAGVDGIVVSNHGGRQVDGAVGALETLAPIVREVRGRIKVLFDSGIRTGADVFKALAMGADAVCVGRPYAYGLALGGAAGVEAVLRNLLADFAFNAALAGCRDLAAIRDATLVPA